MLQGKNGPVLNTRQVKPFGPVAQLGRVAADAHVGAHGGNTVLDHEHLVPAGRCHVCVRGRGDGASGALAAKGGEEGAGAHRVSMRARYRAEQRDLQGPRGRGTQCEACSVPVVPILVRDREGGPAPPGRQQVWRREYLDSDLLRVLAILWVRARHQHPSIQ